VESINLKNRIKTIPTLSNNFFLGGMLPMQKCCFFQLNSEFLLNFLNVKKKVFLTEILEQKKNTVFFQKTSFSKNTLFALITYPPDILVLDYHWCNCLPKHHQMLFGGIKWNKFAYLPDFGTSFELGTYE
jgi:hypothetical protein